MTLILAFCVKLLHRGRHSDDERFILIRIFALRQF